MTSIPLHPALVHLPLGLALVLPVLATGFTWALWSGRIPKRGWLAVVALQAVLLGAGLVALNTGQREAERVEVVVPEKAIETHEAYAEQFLWVTGAALAVAAIVVLVRRPAAVRALSAATVLGTLLVAAAAVRVGHAGGELVYAHNAGAVYSSASKDSAQAESNTGARPVAEVDGDDAAR